MKDNGLIWYENNKFEKIKLKKKFLNGDVCVEFDTQKEKMLFLNTLRESQIVWRDGSKISYSDGGVEVYFMRNGRLMWSTQPQYEPNKVNFKKIIKKSKKTIKPEFFTEKIAVNCKTKKQAKKFLKKLDKTGDCVINVDNMLDYWKIHKETTCFCLIGDNVAYNNKYLFEDSGNNYKILDYKDILE